MAKKKVLTTSRDWLEREARRVLTDDTLKPNPALIAEGWERRFVADARRAKEAIELYEQLGFEVHAEPVRPTELGDDCEDCKLVVAFQFQTIYTRKGGGARVEGGGKHPSPLTPPPSTESTQ